MILCSQMCDKNHLYYCEHLLFKTNSNTFRMVFVGRFGGITDYLVYSHDRTYCCQGSFTHSHIAIVDILAKTKTKHTIRSTDVGQTYISPGLCFLHWCAVASSRPKKGCRHQKFCPSKFGSSVAGSNFWIYGTENTSVEQCGSFSELHDQRKHGEGVQMFYLVLLMRQQRYWSFQMFI